MINFKNTKNIKAFALILFAAILLVFIAVIPSCFTETDELESPIKISDFDRSLLDDISEQAEIYRPYLESFEESEKSEVSDKLKTAIENIRSGSNGDIDINDINEITDQFNKAAEDFRIYYFDSENGNKIKDAELINKLYIDGVKCAYDEKSRTFFYTMGQIQDREFKFNFYIESGMKTFVFAEIYNSGGDKLNYRFIPELNKEYILKSYSDKVIFEYKIIFTVLPIIQIDNIGNIVDEYKNCTISVTDPDFSYSNPFSDSATRLFFDTMAKIHIRGGIARGFPKKSYAVKFTDEKGENKDFALFGMRNDSDWILDAMYIDKARARNRISTDLWNDYNSRLYYMKSSEKSQLNGTRGIFVEVFLRDEYIGLYCFTEKIDRKQLKLLKDEGKSFIYKGTSWEDPVLFRKSRNYNNNSSYWGGFKQKYPNPSKNGEINWKPLADFVDFAVNSTDKDFAANIEKYIDIDNFVDYVILLCISYAYDNTGKNCHWSIYDITDPDMSKIFLTPWDMDATWGRSWESSKIPAVSDWMDIEYEHDTYLFRRLIKTNAGGFADKLKSRWEELKDNILSPESIVSRFDAVFDLFSKSGAWDRESARWRESKLDLEAERKYIKEWTFERWAFIDDFMKNKLDTLSVQKNGDLLTREQIASAFFGYIESLGINVSERADLSGFDDSGEISVWALDAMQWSVAVGLIRGLSDTKLGPGGYATRAEIEIMKTRLFEIYDKEIGGIDIELNL
ncbi:MAG: CotH kinase family protein [Oscillospiraceae bacterium]|nr:CotH kinase family protein [Oscillospiraceae bacterium]